MQFVESDERMRTYLMAESGVDFAEIVNPPMCLKRMQADRWMAFNRTKRSTHRKGLNRAAVWEKV